MRTTATASCVVAVTILASGCGGLNMESHYRNYRSDLLSGNYASASKYVEGKKEDFYGEKNRLLYYMDQGMILHLAKKYKESNSYLEKAKTAAEELWTDSVGENAAAWLSTDNSISYQGEDFEKVMIHFVAALNYMETGDLVAARVEARQVTNKLELYNSKYEESKSVYSDDAFARWLAGKLRETEGGQTGLNEAWIDYKKAITIYETDYKRYRTPVPLPLIQDALRVLDGLGADFQEEFTELQASYPRVQFTPQAEAATQGHVVLVYLSGEAPYKIDQFWTAKANKQVLRIAFPKFVAKPHRMQRARLTAGGASAETVLAENITAIAIQNLDDRMGRIKAKAIARAVAKFIGGAAAQAGGKALSKRKSKGAKVGGAALQVVGALWNVGQAAAEEADKRGWVTLPSQVSIAQVFVPPGDVVANVQPAGGPGVQLAGKVQAGKTLFLVHRTFQ